jgi:hypothetical protein
LEDLSDASILGKLLVLPANVRLDCKVIARYKHSSLFGLVICNEGKKFYNMGAWPFVRLYVYCRIRHPEDLLASVSRVEGRCPSAGSARSRGGLPGQLAFKIDTLSESIVYTLTIGMDKLKLRGQHLSQYFYQGIILKGEVSCV